jgi:TPR repeat protein
MKSLLLVLAFALVLLGGLRAEPADPGAKLTRRSERLVLEEKHFAECLAYVYNPALWVSYHGSLYFAPKSDAQARQIESLKNARAQYVALTNREARHAFAAQVFAASGIGEAWQKRLLLPYSDTNPNLTPTLSRPYSVVHAGRVVQSVDQTDALVQDSETNLFLVINFSAPLGDATLTNLFLIKEGERAFATAADRFTRIEAFSPAGLNAEDSAILNRVVIAFQKQAASLAAELSGFKENEEFELSKARATDNNPYLQYLVARSYLDGKGTPKDEKLGLEWMNRAAKSGSGDAKAYLEQHGRN